MDVPVYQQVARNAEKDQQIEQRKEEILVEHVVKANGRVHEPAGCDKDQSAMHFLLRAPKDGKRDARAKGDHVVERDARAK